MISSMCWTGESVKEIMPSSVKEKMPFWGTLMLWVLAITGHNPLRNSDYRACMNRVAVDRPLSCMLLFLQNNDLEVHDEQICAWRRQTVSIKSGRSPEPPSGKGHRRAVPYCRLLRSPRFGATQIRDGAPSKERGAVCDSDRSSVWVLPADLLSGKSRLGSTWAAGASFPAPRPARGAQAHGQGVRFCRGETGRGSKINGWRTGAACAGAVWVSDSPTQYRTSSPQAAGKKGGALAGSTPATAGAAADQPGCLVDAYEDLRATVVGVCGLSAAPQGLAVLIRQGMPAWMSAWERYTAPATAYPWRSSSCRPRVHASAEIVAVLVGMALSNQAGNQIILDSSQQVQKTLSLQEISR